MAFALITRHLSLAPFGNHMDERIVKFINALRVAGIRVSLAESADAFRAIETIGVKDRKKFRLSLQATLIKDAQNLATFNEMFAIFFGSGTALPMLNSSDELTPEEAQRLAQALRTFGEQLQHSLKRLAKGEKLSQDVLERLAKMVGLNQIEDMRYRKWMVERMKKALRFREVREAIQELAVLLANLGMDKARVEQLVRTLGANQQAMEEQLRQFAGQRIADTMGKRQHDDGIDGLLGRSFSNLTEQDRQQLRKEVQRLAAILKTRVALRQKRAKSGHLDAKATIRANLKHGNVPIQIKHREHNLRPKLVVICDVSTSMRFCSELMLSLLFALQDQISKTHAFAFIDHLEFISPYFAGRSPKEAVAQVLARMPAGYYNTDLGNSLANFEREYMNTVDGRTTFIIVGDGRNNYNNPRLDIFNRLARRSRRTIWITPEVPGLWGTGDSDMWDYAPECDVVLRAATMAELTEAVDKLLAN